MWAKRIKLLLAMLEIGGGVLALIAPGRYARFWLQVWPFGPESLRKITLWFADNPNYTRLGSVVGIGVWSLVALRQFQEEEE